MSGQTHKSLITFDTVDDRRELWSLLHRLSPRARVSFLAWCCTKVRRADGNGPVASSRMCETVEGAYRCDRFDLRLTNECFMDCLMLTAQWGLDLATAAVELERRVRVAHRAARTH